MRNIIKYFLFPTLFYLIFFIILTYPAILSFSRGFFADSVDGLQNIWNVWWVNYAITTLHQSIWQTNHLYYPFGTTLIGHTLTPINGLIGIALLKFFSFVTTYNILVTFAFVGSGLSVFFLSYFLSKSFFGSLVSGYIFTFSQYHFAHAEGHLQTISMQFIPLFILFWIKLLEKPRLIYALAASIFLYFNLLADYYYFFYLIVFMLVYYLWQVWQKKDFLLSHGKKLFFNFVVFFLISLITAGRLVTALILQNLRDPLFGFHPPAMFSSDLLSLMIPGGHWRFAELTSNFWQRLPGNINESSVAIGISIMVMLLYVWFIRTRYKASSQPGRLRASRIPLRFWTSQNDGIFIWFLILSLFLSLSFGPKLHIYGKEYSFLPMPYAILEKIFPLLSLSGVPIRMMVMVFLSAAIIVSFGIDLIIKRKSFFILALFLILLFIEYLPKEIPVTEIKSPSYAKFLRTKNDTDGVLDLASDVPSSMYYQTIHQHPLAGGYIARVPQSVAFKNLSIQLLISDQKYDVLCQDYGVRYVVVRKSDYSPNNQTEIYNDDNYKIYDLEKLSKCQSKQK